MIRFFASHPTAGNLLMLLLLVMGVMALPSIQRATFPDFAVTQIEVRVPYPGATAADVEEAIVRRIENAVDSVEYVEEVRSEARDNVGIVTLEMSEEGDPSVFLTDIKTEVEAIDEFPDRAEDPIIRPIQRTDAVVSIAVAGDMSVADLKAHCEDVKERLQRLPDISLVTIKGFGQRQIRVEVPAVVLMQYGISADRLARVLSMQSLDLPAGVLQSPDRDIVLRFTDERRTPREFEDLVVAAGASGGEIRLGDIATIQDVFEPEEDKILFNGRRAGILVLEKTKSEDTLRVFDAARGFVERENLLHPRGVSLTLTENVSSVVRDRLEMLVSNGLQGLLLVFLAMWLFFGFRYSFWVAMGLPVAFLGALFFMPILGMTINMLTMVALLMALGLMMDDAIVLAENIATELSKGKQVLDATVDGVRRVAPGVISSFLTTVAVFTPLAFLSGRIGTVLQVVPIVLILVLAVSLVEAFLILPHHLAHSRRGGRPLPPNRFRTRFDAGVGWIRENVVGRLVDFAVSWRYLTVGLTVAAFLASIGMLAGGHIRFQAFPSLDGDLSICRVTLPAGTPLKRTEAIVERITEAAAAVDEEFRPRQPGGQHLVRNVTVRFNENPDAHEQGPHVATVTLDLLPAEQRDARVDDILKRWSEHVGIVPDAVALAFTQGAFGPAGRPIEIRLHAEDLQTLDQEADRVRAWLHEQGGVRDIMSDLRPGKPEALIRLRPGARVLGLTAADVATQLRTAFYGATAGELQVGTESYEVDVRLARRNRDGLSDLDYFHVTLPTGKQVPIGAVASVEESRGYARIARVDGRRTVTVQAEVDTRVGNTAEILKRFRQGVVPSIEAKGIDITFEGEAKEGGQTSKSMIRGLLIGLIGVFLILSFQFRSFVEPVTVMVAIPFALIGVVWGHVLMGLSLSLPSMLGFASLAGIVVNDSILLVEFIKHRRREGSTTPDAARAASRDRFRAVLLTSLTTILGLLPLLTEPSLQAQILIPLVTSVIFGLLASTVLVLLVIPCLYSVLGDLGLVTKVEEPIVQEGV